MFRYALAAAIAMAPWAAKADGGPLVVYNAQHDSLTKAWAEGFTRETGIKVVLRKGSDTELANQIVQEGASSPADVFVTENSPSMALVESAGLFAPIAGDVLSQVPDRYRPSSGQWVGIAARSTVFAYDKTRLGTSDLPKSMLDLAGAGWKGRWAASPAGADFQAIVGALLQLKGEGTALGWLKAMKANAVLYKGNSTAMKAVNAGEVPGALIYHYYYFGDQAKTGENSKNIALHYFRNEDPGAFVSLSGGGVLKSSKRADQAQAFLKWITGKGGQDILRNGDAFEYAVGKNADSNAKLVPLGELQAPSLDPSKLDSKKVNDLMIAAGLL